MAINLLGSEEPKKEKKSVDRPIEYHIPKEEALPKKKVKERIREKRDEREQQKEEKVVQKGRQVNMVTAFSGDVLGRRLRSGIIFAILLLALGTGGYVVYTLVQTGPIEIPEVERTTPIVPAPTTEPAVSETPASEPEPVVALPDTPLVPLRGALVRFSGDPTIYLVEDNGELRKVILQSVIFDNGQRISDIELSRIYLINSEWQSVRKGKDVMGQVDWDPRVLLPGEIDSFIY